MSDSSNTIPDPAAAATAIDAIDLQEEVFQAQRLYGWSPQQAADVEAQYRTFLKSCVAAGGPVEPPSADVDRFWHLHLLHTRKYREECRTFMGAGRHLDHVPVAQRGQPGQPGPVHAGVTCYGLAAPNLQP
ncbi:MAG: hypothetical protein M3024_06075 [Candidatus Dormibacteraeota bacterium]|nr:hypothetical protein [Candidatus Dormibacteraeota bacterium]